MRLPPAQRPWGAHRPVVRPIVAIIVRPVMIARVIRPVVIARVPVSRAPIMVPVMVGAGPPVAVPPAARLGLARPEQPGEHDNGERHNDLLHRTLRGITLI